MVSCGIMVPIYIASGKSKFLILHDSTLKSFNGKGLHYHMLTIRWYMKTTKRMSTPMDLVIFKMSLYLVRRRIWG